MTNQNIIVGLFAVESEAYQAFSQLKSLQNTHDVIVAQAALIKKNQGTVQLEEIFDPTGNGDAVITGGLIGALVGVLAGPIGVLLGGSLGILLGGDVAAAKDLDQAGIIEIVANKLKDNDVAVVLLAEENKENPVNELLGQFKTTVLRWDADTVREEVVNAFETQIDLEKQARAALREKKSAERQADLHHKWEELKHNVQTTFDNLKAKL